ncbi:C1D-domain-containing protein [Lentinus tigrinus ALCF2SS1-7]|uniref:C1D-domain-containing protein n=1 Tax=Lentinus tigrinus ALCF2SS1-7 TaxID=1328758 RepID=UPI001165DB92|nr:C1D-domain-containing protein [Lentinus tigrinus ALCF2SS1-7]
MADSSEKLLARLATLNDSLDDLEDKLEPLLSQTLPESLLPLETIQQVKLNVAIPYLVYDLVFIYLKTRGIDPKTHPVVAELDRVRQYFDKIKNAEDPEKRKTAVDKAAANRFIKHAIAQAKESSQTPGAGASSNTHIRFDAAGNAPSPAPGPSSSSTPRAPPAPGKVTSKMLARAEWQKQVAAGQVGDVDMDEDDDEADALEVFDEDEDEGDEEDGELEKVSSKAKGKGRAADGQEDAKAAGGKKRRRPAVDPFAGYGDEASTKSSKSSKKKKASPQAGSEDVDMDGEPTSGNSTPKSARKVKSGEKKAKRKAKKATAS